MKSPNVEPCAFCEIIAGRAPVSVVCEDEVSMCLMTLRPTRPGECLVIPKTHIDHFIDIPEDLYGHLTRVARGVGRALQAEYSPLRVGLVVHGFGVPHAHFILVPQHHVHDITSRQFAVVEDGEVAFRHLRIPELPRKDLDLHAEKIGARLRQNR